MLFTCYNKVLGTALRSESRVSAKFPRPHATACLIKDVFEHQVGPRVTRTSRCTPAPSARSASTRRKTCGDRSSSSFSVSPRPNAEWFLADGTGQELYDEPKEHFLPASKLAGVTRDRHGVVQQLNRQRRMSTSGAAGFFARAVFDKSLDTATVPRMGARVSDFRERRPGPRPQASMRPAAFPRSRRSSLDPVEPSRRRLRE